MYLRPSEICFSQDSIGRTFGRCTFHAYRPIGETLDDILTGRINVNSIPNISVYNKNGKWFTADNRRLWVFQEAEKRGKCNKIYVRETPYIDYNKFTTRNEGDSVYVRGNPGGYLWQNMPIKKIEPNDKPHSTCLQTIPNSSYTYQNHIEKMDTTDKCSTELERNVYTFNEMSMTKREESLCFDQDFSKDDNVMYGRSENQYIINVDTDSDVLGQHYSRAKPNVTETVMEEKVENEREIRYNEEAVNNSLDILRIPIYMGSNSETSEPLENRDVVVTMFDETNDNPLKCKKSKRCISFIWFFVLVLIALLGLRSAGDL